MKQATQRVTNTYKTTREVSSTGEDRAHELSSKQVCPYHDNVLVLMDWLRDIKVEEKSASGMLVLPRATKKPESGEEVWATVIAAGPGCYLDKWLDHERGTSVVGSSKFLPNEVRPGDRVLIDHADQGAPVLLNGVEHRIVRQHNVLAVAEES